MWFLLFLLMGCGKGRPKAPPVVPVAAQELPAPQRGRTLPRIQAELLPLEAPNAYDVRLSWDGGSVLADEWWIQRMGEGASSPVVARLPREHSHFIDRALEPSKKYTYRLSAYEEGKSAELGVLEVEIPQDWSPEPGVHPWPTTRHGRWFLGRGTIVQAGAEDRQVELIELHSDGAVLESFPEGAQAAEGMPGRRGAKISLNVRRATGVLDLISRGERGGDGRTGDAGVEGTVGKDAIAGTYIVHNDLVNRGGILSLAVRIPIGHLAFETAAPVAAGDGMPGSPGGPGGSGGGGGDSGGIVLNVENALQFLPRPLSLAGDGGRAGLGGAGGRGGRGGKGITNNGVSPIGSDRKAGVDGADGTQGASGQRGIAGKAGPIQVKLGGFEARFP